MLIIHVSGMQCDSCVASLQRVLPPSFASAQIDLGSGMVRVAEASAEDESALCQAITQAGFRVERVEHQA
ncbi:MAG: copper chaperone [Planctomycetota bacterium]|nr:MAG: copper chaperone [Planctomycetota bacterium]